MALINCHELLQQAQKEKYQVPAFYCHQLEQVEGVLQLAEQNGSPVLLAVRESDFDSRSYQAFILAVEHLASSADVAVSLVAYCMDEQSSISAINAGCQAIIIEQEQTIISPEQFNKLVKIAHSCGIAIAFQLTENFTPDLESIDFLDVSKLPVKQQETIRELNAQYQIPLIGTTIIRESKLDLSAVLYKQLNNQQLSEIFNISNSANQSKQVLAHCTAWKTIEHLIIFNVQGINNKQAQQMMELGKAELTTIPGVRQVLTGTAIKQEAVYQYVWLIRFCHINVIDSYREHPIHVSFADNLFRPVAGDRISIDYLLNFN